MIPVRWRKVFHDLVDNKIRSLLVIFSIFIGVALVGFTISLYITLDEDLDYSWSSITPFHAQLFTEDFDEDTLETIKKIPGLGEVQAKYSFSARLRIGPDDWVPIQITAIPDYLEQKVDIVKTDNGAWPPGEHQFLIERGSLVQSKSNVGEVVEIKLPDDTVRSMKLTGVVHDGQVGVGTILGLYGYVNYDDLEWLHQPLSLNRLSIRISKPNPSKIDVDEVADRVSEHLRKAGKEVWFVLAFDPGENPGKSQVLGVVQIMGVLGFLAVALAGFLIFNTFSSLMNQHVRHIGIMKAVGAHRSQIISMYVVLILTFSIMAILPAIPIAALFTEVLNRGMAVQFNYETLGFRLVPAAVIAQLVVGFLVPLVTGIIPVLVGVHITIREAIYSYGLSAGRFGKNWIDRLVERIRGLSRPMLIAIRNTFRRKGRLALTLSVLILGGAIFIAVFNLRSSMVAYIDIIGKYFLSDVNITFNQNYPIEKIEDALLGVPGVERVEGWAAASGELLRDNGEAEESVQLLAPPTDSSLIEPLLISGRWVLPDDENAIVVNNAFWRVRPDLKVGDDIQLKINNKDTTWRVVGFFQFPGDLQLFAYTGYKYLAEMLNAPNRAVIYRIVASDHSPQNQVRMVKLIETRLRNLGLQTQDIQPGSALGEANAAAINTIVWFFLSIAIAIALVGAIGLMGTMSMNVLERTREIGVMRSLGASNLAVFSIVLVEGMMIGLLSWLIAAILAMPISRFLFLLLSQAIFRSPGKFTASMDGFLIWLGLTIFLCVAASFLPAYNAARLTIREVLAYE